MAMENNELLEALRHIIKEETRAAVKEEVQPIKDDIIVLTADWTIWNLTFQKLKNAQ